MDQKKTGQKWFKEQWKHILIQSLSDKEEPHYLKTQARSPILEDFGLE